MISRAATELSTDLCISFVDASTALLCDVRVVLHDETPPMTLCLELISLSPQQPLASTCTSSP